MTPQGVAIAVLNFLVMAVFWGGLVWFLTRNKRNRG